MRKPSWHAWGGIAIVLATLYAYAPALVAGFLNLDDHRYITALRPFSVASVTTAFAHFFEGYHPLTLFTLGLNFRLTSFDPLSFHATNILLHLANVGLVCGLAWRLLRDRTAALLTGAIFALHPIHMEAVAWITSRKDVQYACFYLLGLWLYASDSPRHPWRRQVGIFACFLLAVLSKGMAVSFPLALLAMDVALRRPMTLRTVLWNKLPFWLGALAFGIVSILAQQASGYAPPFSIVAGVTSRVALALGALWQYAAHLVDLGGITAFHPYPPAAVLQRDAFLGAGFLLTALAVCVWAWRRQPVISGAILLFLGAIGLVLQVVPVADFIVADRYNYISSIGFCLLVAMLIRRAMRQPLPATVTGAFVALYLLALTVSAHAYAMDWRDSDTLWSHVIQRHPDAVFALNMRACNRNDLRQYARALPDFDRAAMADPDYPRTYLNRGFAREKLGDLAGARADYDHLLSLDPNNALAHNNRGLLALRAGEISAAMSDFDAAIRIAPQHPQSHLFFANRASAHFAAGAHDPAIEDATASIQRWPQNFRAWMVRAQARHARGDLAPAMDDLNAALRIDGRDQTARQLFAAWNQNGLPEAGPDDHDHHAGHDHAPP